MKKNLKKIFRKPTEILEMDPDLMHPSCEGSAEHHTGTAVEAHPLKLCPVKNKPDKELIRRT